METWEDESRPLNREKIRRTLSKILEAKLNKKFRPQTRYDATFRGNDITYYTNELGEPVTLFIGERQKDGNIKGEYYTRTIKHGEGEKVIKSHWDNKGKVKGGMRK